uniref:Uncharacterized protein AlNc14C348G10885 n=1 Tax=Albugo laibachii Nc14 TaxID=890382 RepID=F0WXD3_9STRA|nr:conserved hypothetical protein [Albugo laibachii Nc14]|eukprot:CCA26125.1 conserved hypothetical protein [Albugo laibachii Nc14]
MFPTNRFTSLLPSAPSLKQILRKENDEDLEFVPKTSKDYGSRIVVHQFWPAYNVIAYMRMANLNFHVHNSRYPRYEVSGELPQLHDGNYLLSKSDINLHLQTFHTDIDVHLTAEEKADLFAFRSIVTEKLAYVLLYCRWVDDVEYTEVTLPQLRNVIPFPLNRILPKMMRNAALREAQAHGICSREKAYMLARDCYASLNAKVSENSSRYSFGYHPTSLDAEIVGHVIDGLANTQLRDVLFEFAPSLIDVAKTVRAQYFSRDPEDYVGCLKAYTENEDNYFVKQTPRHFLDPVSFPVDKALLTPYQSIDWRKREMIEEIVEEKIKSSSDRLKDPSQDSVGIEGKRNLVIGAVVTFALYAISCLPIEFASNDSPEDPSLSRSAD